MTSHVHAGDFERTLEYAKEQAAAMDLRRIDGAGLYIKPLDYYVLGSVYPPLKAMSPIAPELAYSNASDDLSLYLHIPFCDQYCTFCHFAKVINPASDRVTRYLRALATEIEQVSGSTRGSQAGPDHVLRGRHVFVPEPGADP